MKSLAHVVAFATLALATTVRANDVDPFGFEKEHFVSSKSRAEVVAERDAARVAGLLPVPGEIGVRFVDAPSSKPREQVDAETLEAKRLGLLSYGESGPRPTTPAEEQQIRLAGLRALERLAAAKRMPMPSGS